MYRFGSFIVRRQYVRAVEQEAACWRYWRSQKACRETKESQITKLYSSSRMSHGHRREFNRVLIGFWTFLRLIGYQTGICCRSIYYYTLFRCIESWNHWNFNFRCELADSWSSFSQTFVFRCVNNRHPDIRHVGIAEVKAQPLTQWIFGSGCRLFMQKVCQGMNLHQLPLTRRLQRIHMKGDSPMKNKLSHIKYHSL